MALGGLFNRSKGTNGTAAAPETTSNTLPTEKNDSVDPPAYGRSASGSDSDPPASKERRFSRIAPPVGKPRTGSTVPGEEPDHFQQQLDEEEGNAIKYRTCSWQKTAALLFSEYICLAIMSFPWSYSILGLIPGLILTIFVAVTVGYTSLIVWELCMRHPEVKDVVDLGHILFGGNKFGKWFTFTIFILNNTFIQGFHCLTGAKYLNTMTGHTVCTIGFSAIIAVASWIGSMPRTFSSLSYFATASAFFTFVSVLLATIFAAVEPAPAGYPKLGPIQFHLFAPKGTSFVDGMNAFLNISYTFIGQITLPSFIAEMEKPEDFPKALWTVTIAEILIFSVVGSVIYAYTGTNYMTSPAFGSIGNTVYQKISFSFMVPTILFLGILYASVSSRFVFNAFFQGTKHMTSHTAVGWAAWIGILGCTWVAAFIIAEVIPFFSDLLSLMSSLFDSFFGYIFWGWGYILLRRASYGPRFWQGRGWRGYCGLAAALFFFGIGILFLSAGTYATIQSIIYGYEKANFGGAFSCASNALAPATAGG